MSYKVYMHTNKIDGKKYIGITCLKPERRWKNGNGYKGSPAFYGAILKYGWDSFTHEILYTNLTAKEAQQKEIELIAKYNTQGDDGYNILAGGDLGTVGIHPSKETRKKQSLAHLQMTDETKEKMRHAQLGRKHSPETIAKMKRNSPHTPQTEERKKQISERMSGKNSAWYGRKHSPEEIAKMKAGSKNQTPEYKKHISEALKGKKRSEEAKRINGLVHRKAVLQYDLNGELIKEWSCQSAVAKTLGLSQGCVSNCCKGRQKTTGGFIWKFKQGDIKC